jgi:hypothetical protein
LVKAPTIRYPANEMIKISEGLKIIKTNEDIGT